MNLTIDAVFENGVLRPLSPLPLAEKQQVRIVVAPVESTTCGGTSFRAVAGELIGSVDSGVDDLASNERHLEGFGQ
jgi:predicted DNA-binding antitoxin AbrB/MazE fold protein